MSTEEMVQQEMFESAKSPEPSEPSEAPSETPSESISESSSEQSERPERPEQTSERSSQERGEEREERIPSWRLREEAEARRVAEDRARALEQRMNQIQTHWQQQQKAQQAQKPVPDFFEDPAAATQAAIHQQLQPVLEQNRRAIMQMSRDVAEWRHGPEAVQMAEQYFMQARDQRMLDPADYERVVNAPNRYDAAVQWYKKIYALSTVGDDPNAWWQQEFETRMADPKFQAEIMERVKGSAATRPGMTKLPPSLSKSTAAASNGSGGGDFSHSSMWASAIK